MIFLTWKNHAQATISRHRIPDMNISLKSTTSITPLLLATILKFMVSIKSYSSSKWGTLTWGFQKRGEIISWDQWISPKSLFGHNFMTTWNWAYKFHRDTRIWISVILVKKKSETRISWFFNNLGCNPATRFWAKVSFLCFWTSNSL